MDLRKLYFLTISCLLLNNPDILAQDQKVADSLSIIYQQNEDTTNSIEQFKLLVDLSFNETRDLKKGLQYADEIIKLAVRTGNDKYLRIGYFLKGTKKRLMGNLEEALDAYFKSAEIATKTQNLNAKGETYGAIADIYTVAKNYPNAINYYNKAITTLRQLKGDSISLASVLLNIGDAYLKVKVYDSALIYLNEAKVIFDKKDNLTGKAYSIGNIGMVYADVNKNSLAEQNINEAINILEKTQDYYPICVYLISMADLYINKGDKVTALSYTQRSLELAEKHKLNEQIADASFKLSKLYEEAGNDVEAYKYYRKHIAYRDSINNINIVQKMADLRTDHEVSQKQVEVNMLNQQKRNERNLTIALGFILALTLLILGILFRNFQNKRKAYTVLDLQKKETDAQKVKVEHTLSELQLTQKQLIQTAKLASLGELTVGVAHEIQNPLNFVTNFSEVGVELLHDLREATVNKLKDSDQAQATAAINDLADTLKKINTHGKRADSIVKGMLQHSMASTGKKEPVDISFLADEYLRLSYNGFRAKEKESKVILSRNFDKSIEPIEVVPQDIGRVLLNLYNNAFYSVNEKKSQSIGAYEPCITVSTKRFDKYVELSVKDNGMGVSQKVLDKIFQPFFTTKPAGQGTGLGLSLSYDIIKAHGGELKVETKDGEFAMFIILLPIGNGKV